MSQSFSEKKKCPETFVYFITNTKYATIATRVSLQTKQRIKRQSEIEFNVTFSSPGKIYKCPFEKNAVLDNFNLCILSYIGIEFYASDKIQTIASPSRK